MVRPSKFCKFSCQQADFFAINLYLKRWFKLSSEKQSKRMTAHKKYKIQRKVCLWIVKSDDRSSTAESEYIAVSNM